MMLICKSLLTSLLELMNVGHLTFKIFPYMKRMSNIKASHAKFVYWHHFILIILALRIFLNVFCFWAF